MSAIVVIVTISVWLTRDHHELSHIAVDEADDQGRFPLFLGEGTQA